jgi:hypothetical protein
VRDSTKDYPEGQIHATIGNGQSEPTTGVKGYERLSFKCRVTGWSVAADQSGSCVVDIWKDTHANFPPTNADSMVDTGTEPYLSSEQVREDSAPDWSQLTINEGDWLVFNLDSVTTCTQIEVIIFVERID